MKWSPSGGLEVEVPSYEGDPHTWPFALRQPIHKGQNFFLYSEKYASLWQWLMQESAVEAGADPDKQRYLKLYRDLVWNRGWPFSKYIDQLFRIASFAYVDKFGSESLFEFSLYLEDSLGTLRLENSSVRHETVINYLVKKHRNLLDVISSAFIPAEVISFLKDEQGQLRNPPPLDLHATDVPNRYAKAVLQYFLGPVVPADVRRDLKEMSDLLKRKRDWIPKKIADSRATNVGGFK